MDLEEHSRAPVIVYAATVASEGLPVLYEALRRRGQIERLSLVLITAGGSVTSARQLALLVRDHVELLVVLVPRLARSAGTLVCLAADELVLGPLAELSAIDAQISPRGELAADLPGLISAEDVRTFPEMAREWFGVSREEDSLQLLALVAQRIFPTSLSAFFRNDRLVRDVADELLRLPVAAMDEGRRRAIVDELVRGRHSHDDAITRSDARALGLPVRHPDDTEEALLWELWQACGDERHYGPEGQPYGLIAAEGFLARETRRWSEGAEGRRFDIEWEVQA